MYSRTQPLIARIQNRSLLNGPGSSKQTYHIELNLGDAHLPFQVGDSVGIFPTNPPTLVTSILKRLNINPRDEIFDSRTQSALTIEQFLSQRANIHRCSASFLRQLHDRGATKLAPFLTIDNKQQLADCLHQNHFDDLLRLFPGAHLCAQDLTGLMPLMPRFYSIASSPHTHPGQLHLTVALNSYTAHGETRYGLGSYFLCSQADTITPIPIYIQMSNGFTLPTDPNVPIILIGPGTGVAPFRAFLQERLALQHLGKNWLFFGERNRATDFYYSDFFLELEHQNRLRLDLAFSRDQSDKIYVQHLLWEHRKALFEWVQAGAYIYVCGDAEKMAKDVEKTFLRIATEQFLGSEDQARQWLKSLRHQRRYLTDVY